MTYRDEPTLPTSGSMSRRSFARLAALSGPALALGPRSAVAQSTDGVRPATPPAAGSQASPVHAQALEYDQWTIIDALGFPGDAGTRLSPQFSLESLADIRASGITAVNTTVGTVGTGEDLFEQAVASVASWQRALTEHPDTLMAVRTVADIAEAKASGRLGVILGFQDSAMFEGELDRIDVFHDLGVKVIQLTYNRRNELGDGSIEAENLGLTDFGREAVSRMNELGVLVDLSHCGHRTTDEGIDASTRPVAITHSGCYALAAMPRNKPDATLRTLAEQGGVVGIYLMPFLRESGQPMAEDVIAHIEHALDVCGEDHVGIGTDGGFGTVELTPEYVAAHRADVAARRAAGISAPGENDDVYTFIPDLNTPRRFEQLGSMLLNRGHDSARVEKILGGNFLRLMDEVW